MRQKYTNEILAEIAKKYNNAKEWCEDDIKSYKAAAMRKILNKINKHFVPLQNEYTNEQLFQIAQKYSNATEWIKNEGSSYIAAHNRNIYYDITKHFVFKTKYTNEQLSKIAGKYTNTKEWIKDDSKTYHAARRRNLLNEITKHFIRKPGGFNPELPGQFYQFKFKNHPVYNYGISNDYTKRYRKEDLDKMELLKVIEFKDGHKCWKYETEIQKQFQKYRYTGVQLLSEKKNTELLTVDIF